MEIWMKSPDKIRTTTKMNGQEMTQAFDGEKGYMTGPGSSQPVAMSAEQISSMMNNNIFQNYIENYLRAGKLELAGEEVVNGRPAFKVKANIDGGNTAYMLIDKSSYLMLKTVAQVNQGGMGVTVEMYPSDYREVSGLFLPMKTKTTAGGMELMTTFNKVEVDVPMDDSLFRLK
jgi:outer membrane lipoprotein-sorting protein